ncbi:MAG: M10 family metallopeptidase C-terminal domain-containing protein [Paracoccus sp. (in: a-proteobacteria)]
MPITNVIPGQLGMSTPFDELKNKTTAQIQAELADYVSLGVDWVRVDINWSVVQSTAGSSFNWSQVDRIFNLIEAAGIEIVAVLNDLPDWMDTTLSTTDSQQGFANFARAAANRYGDTINYWEIINEPNKAGIDPADYTEALKLSYQAIKETDPSDIVISGGTAAVPSTGNGMWSAVDYLEQIYANGGRDYFDAVGYHPYTFPLYPSDDEPWNGWQIMEDGIRAAMLHNGDGDKQVWMTELGAPTWGQSINVTETEQAHILREAVQLAQTYDWAGPIMWFGYQDSDFETGFGLRHADGSPKLAYDAFSELASNDNIPPVIGNTGLDSDDIEGSDAVDLLEGTDEDSILVGMGGNDTILGNGGDDMLSGGHGDDRLLGHRGNDTLYGGLGNDTQQGNGGNDLIYGDSGNDLLTAHSGHDRLYGGEGNDTLQGNSGNDLLVGGTGNDTLHGGNGNDTLEGGVGNDALSGKAGNDVYRFSARMDWDRILDFTPGQDKIDLSSIDAQTVTTGTQSFTFIGTATLSNAGDLGVYHDYTNRYTYVQGDLDGDDTYDFSIRLNGIHDLGEDDFIL